ncbi:hypothetical protein EDB89DRAFT_1980354 [Lactarius sanguifluus]|nr:hypothetical protein EDB89DRAFT_1980354 [Lactarius sanguifluus]
MTTSASNLITHGVNAVKPLRQAHLSIVFVGRGLNFQVPYVVHAVMLSNVGHLSIVRTQAEFCEQDYMCAKKWLPFLHLFPAVETIFVSRNMAGFVASALEDIPEGMATEVLPGLRLLCLEDDGHGDDEDYYDYDNILDYDYVCDGNYERIEPVGSTQRFLSLRKLSGRPVTIVNDRGEFVERLSAPRMY